MASTMLPFVAETFGPEALHAAWAEFSGEDDPFDPETPHIQVFMPWFFHRWSPDPHDTGVADTALHGAMPLQFNGFKVELAKRAIVRALTSAAQPDGTHPAEA